MATDSLPDVVVLMGVLSVVAFASLPLLARRSGKAAPTAELTAARVVTFAGYEWMIVNGSGQSPCSSYCYSDSGQSVWIDYVGHLHMKLRCVGNEWLCCELVCQESPGFGRYEFRVEGRLDRLDPNVELDLSLEAVDTVAASDGIGLSLSGHGDRLRPTNSQYQIRPVEVSGHRYRFQNSADDQSTHSFEWRPTSIWFQSFRGHRSFVDSPEQVIAFYGYEGDHIASEADKIPRIRLRLTSEHPPSDGREVEIVISDFVFHPMN